MSHVHVYSCSVVQTVYQLQACNCKTLHLTWYQRCTKHDLTSSKRVQNSTLLTIYLHLTLYECSAYANGKRQKENSAMVVGVRTSMCMNEQST